MFLGASYFRALGKGLRYGLSARGLAIDTVGGSGEEFPRFSEFWIVRPTADSKVLTIYALLESPRANGAYQFDVHPGDETVMDVKARLFLRDGINTLGIAPLTSMFAFGENQPHRTDFRPEVHDSDGLLVATGSGEWLWRPLLNPKQTLTTSFSMPSVKGFGLMQRDRNFSSYEDSEARYELRPSAWVEPVSDWGAGRVELFQLHDTGRDQRQHRGVLGAGSTARQGPAARSLVSGALASAQQMQHPPGAWVTQTRAGRGFQQLADDEQQFVVDFTGPALDALPADAMVKAVVTAPANGEIVESNAYRVEATGQWRMTVRVRQLKPMSPPSCAAFFRAATTCSAKPGAALPPLAPPLKAAIAH